jgi:hypothetical protein
MVKSGSFRIISFSEDKQVVEERINKQSRNIVVGERTNKQHRKMVLLSGTEPSLFFFDLLQSNWK